MTQTKPHNHVLQEELARQDTEKHGAQTSEPVSEVKTTAFEGDPAQARKMEALGLLASGIAHEINTPVQYVTDNVRFAQDGTKSLFDIIALYRDIIDQLPACDDRDRSLARIKQLEESLDLDFLKEDLPEALEHAHEGLDQIAKIVSATKAFAHPGSEEKVPADLNEAIETTVTVARNQWKYVSELTTDLEADLPAVPCLIGEINQVLLNLIVNAAQAIDALGSETLGRIELKTRSVENCVEVCIQDTGCGIKTEHRDKIFDPFFTTKDVGKGTGQGLALCHTIITQKHGGTIHVETEVGSGTTVIITLPLTSDTEEAAQ